MRIVFAGMLCLAIFVISASGRSLRTSADKSSVLDPTSGSESNKMEVVTHFSVLDPTSGSKSNKPVVVTQAFCKSIIASIKSKTQPYWDVEAQKCNVETRAELVEQCSTIIAEFRKQLADVCPPMQPCTENCDKFKPVKYLAKKATLPKWSAFPEPEDAAASRRMAEAQKAVPMPIICKVPPCPQREAAKESTTTTTSANTAKPAAVPVQPVVEPAAKPPAGPPTPAEKQNVVKVLVATPKQ